jgi:hypothetical protein
MNEPGRATCDVCHRIFREEHRWRTRLRGAPKRHCKDRRNCWDAYLARIGSTATMPPNVPASLLRRGGVLYRANVDSLLPRYIERASSEGRMISDADLADIHNTSMGRSLNDLSRTLRRGL